MRLCGSHGWVDSRLSCWESAPPLLQPPISHVNFLQLRAWLLARKCLRKAPTRRLFDFPFSCWSETPEGRNPWVLSWLMKVELRGCIFLALIASHRIFSQGNPPLSPFCRKLWASETMQHLGRREWAEAIRVNQTRWGRRDWLGGLVTLLLAWKQMGLWLFPLLALFTLGQLEAESSNHRQGLGRRYQISYVSE